MPKKSESTFSQSLKDVREVAEFFHKLAHATPKSNLRRRQDLTVVARRKRLRIPAALEGGKITADPRHAQDTKNQGQRAVVLLNPEPGVKTAQMAVSGIHCYKVGLPGGGTVQVCIICWFGACYADIWLLNPTRLF
jgi:hypothetical protein